MARRYKRPPLVEAVCEIRFSADSPWDLTIPGLIYEKLREVFPRKKERQQIGFATGEKGAALSAEARVLFLSEDEKTFVQIAPRLLAVNCLAPYPGWDAFHPTVGGAIATFVEIANPLSVARVGLRYINIIELASNPVKIEDYFAFYPHTPPELEMLGAFTCGIQIPHEAHRDILKVELNNAQAEKPDTCRILLDLDYILLKPGSIAVSDLSSWISLAHSRVEDAFEASINDRTRALFD